METKTTTKPSILDAQVVTRAALYARVSGNDDKYATSGIESQLKEGRSYAEAKGYTVVAEFFEDPTRPTSGYDWLPELERALELAHQGGYDVLIVREIDRLARNRFKQLAIETDLEALGIRVEYVIGQFEDTVEGRLLKGIMSEFAEFERAKTRQRTTRGTINSVKQGNVLVGGAKTPFGYDVEIINGKRTFVVNETEAATIRLIFDLYTKQGKTIYGIETYLDARGIRKTEKNGLSKARILAAGGEPPTGQIKWIAASVSKTLDNETYAGRWFYRKTRRVKDLKTGKVKQVKRPKSEWLMVEAPAIIDEATFTEAQRLKDVNKRIRKRKLDKDAYFLGGMIRCAYCGQSAIGVTTKKNRMYQYYKCGVLHTPRRYKTKCTKSKSQNMKKVDDAVWNWLKGILLNPDTLQQSIDEYQETKGKEQDPTLRMIEASQSKLVDLEGQLKRLIDAYTTGILSLDDLAKNKNDLDKQIADTHKTIEALQAELDPQALTEDDIDAIHKFAAQFRENVDLIDADLPARREIAKLLQVKVVMANDYVDISCVLGQSISRVSFTLPNEL